MNPATLLLLNFRCVFYGFAKLGLIDVVVFIRFIVSYHRRYG